MMHGFQQIVTQAERCDNFVVHRLPPLGDAMGVLPLIWRKKLMDSISGNLGYTVGARRMPSYFRVVYHQKWPRTHDACKVTGKTCDKTYQFHGNKGSAVL